MPELPDVEVIRQYLQATSLHQQIEDVEVRSEGVLEHIDGDDLRSGLMGRSFESTDRHGKYLFASLSAGGWLMLHFGMTGHLVYFEQMEKDPEYDRLLVRFANGYHLAYNSQRKLGEVDLVEGVDSFVQRKGLGPDALDPDFTQQDFVEKMSERRGMAKSMLMNQHILAGIGNVYSDEILYQAEIHPRRTVDTLGSDQLARLYEEMREVLRTAIDHRAQPTDFPDTYLTPHRREHGVCPRCGEPVDRVKVSSRYAYFCPNRQNPPS